MTIGEKRYSLLLVESDELMSMALVRSFTKLPFDIHVVATLDEADRSLMDRKFDAVCWSGRIRPTIAYHTGMPAQLQQNLIRPIEEVAALVQKHVDRAMYHFAMTGDPVTAKALLDAGCILESDRMDIRQNVAAMYGLEHLLKEGPKTVPGKEDEP